MASKKPGASGGMRFHVVSLPDTHVTERLQRVRLYDEGEEFLPHDEGARANTPCPERVRGR